MAVLVKGEARISVPEETVDGYLKDGWFRPGEQPAPKPKRKRSGSRTASKTTKKGASDGVSVRSDSGAGASEEDPGPVQP